MKVVGSHGSWWLNQAIWNYARQNGAFPQVGVKIKKHIWDHHPVVYPSASLLWGKWNTLLEETETNNHSSLKANSTYPLLLHFRLKNTHTQTHETHPVSIGEIY